MMRVLLVCMCVNGCVLQMPEEEKSETARQIFLASQQQTSLNPNILRVERMVVEQLSRRLLGSMEQVCKSLVHACIHI